MEIVQVDWSDIDWATCPKCKKLQAYKPSYLIIFPNYKKTCAYCFHEFEIQKVATKEVNQDE